MWRKISICLLIVIFSVVALAQSSDIEIQLAGESIAKLSPGTSSNIVLKFINNSNKDETVSLKIENPHGWRCFSGLSKIVLPGSKATVKILSFNIPEGSFAGDYLIHIKAFNEAKIQVGTIAIPVTIRPKYELNIKVVSAPEYVFASDTFSVQFVLQNLSNSVAEVEAILKGAGEDEKLNYSLKPDSSVFITRNMRAEKGIIKYTQRSISLTAALVNMPDVRATSHHFYNVIPSGDVKFDPYNRFPIQISTLFVTDNPRGTRDYAMMADITGQGYIDKKNEKLVNFQFRGPDRRGKPLYGINDEYFIEYQSPKTNLMLGDNTYKLSYLTEYSRFGRGGSIEYKFDKFKVGSFVNFPRFYPKIVREMSVHAGYSPIEKLQFNLGYLNKQSDTNELTHLMTMNGTATPFSWVSLDWEYAFGTFNTEIKQAVKTELKINYKPLRLLYNYTMTQKDYPGYFTDTKYMLANGSLSLTKRLNIGANYSFIHQNMALDTLYAGAPFSENMILSMNYRLMKDAGLSASYNFRSRQDRMEPMKFNYNERSLRLILNKRSKSFGFDLMGEYGKTENLLVPEDERISDLYIGRLTLQYRTPKRLSLNTFISYQESNRYVVSDIKNWIYGATLNTPIGKKLGVIVNYQSSYDIEESYRDRSILDAKLSYAINKNNSIEVSSRYNLIKNSLDVKELAYMVRYVHTFNVPISKKENIGKLSGKIINKGVKNIEGIVISIGADRAVSDKNGNYSFPLLASGTYYLMIDYTKAGVNSVPEIPPPYRVEIKPGAETKFDIGLTLSSRITGEISIVKEVAEADKSYAEIKEQLGKLMIEAKSEGEMFRILTDEDGKFSFESLRPGNWTVKIYERGIPKEYELVTDLFNLSLVTGHTHHVEVKIKEKRRRIRFQKSVEQGVAPDYKEIVRIANLTTLKEQAKPSTDAKQADKQVPKSGETLVDDQNKRLEPPINRDVTDIVEQGPSPGVLEYRIQLGAFKNKLGSTKMLADLFKIQDEIKQDVFNGLYIYTIGAYTTYNEALTRNEEIKKRSNTNPFIVSFLNGTKTLKLIKTTPAVKDKVVSGFEYRVQIGANENVKLSLKWLSDLYHLSQPIQEDYFNGYYIYTIGTFKNINDARKLRDILVGQNKIHGAFVVTFKDGKRYTK